MMTRLTGFALMLLGLGLCLMAARTARGQQAPDCAAEPYAEAQVPGTPRILLEIALTLEQRSKGLMFRTEMPPDQGMLFIFEGQTNTPFWNHNTYLPLSIAYVAADGTIVDIQDMQAQPPDMNPRVDTLYPPAGPYTYALEANQGWYANNGVAVGNVLTFCLPPA